ncbi:MAG TPA: HAMP domain-containing sensor histidine kinase [Tangfeifania sp.]|nr:HAMP domain-containing sensor histidine kinase [Tangfeifania sp.]
MNKKIIVLLIVLMGVSILGIIAVQLVWMNNAIRVKNELFNRSVNEALNNTAEKLEERHDLGVVNRMIFSGDSTFQFDADHDFEFHFQVPEPPPPSSVKLPDSLSLKKLPALKAPPVIITRKKNANRIDNNIRVEVETRPEKQQTTTRFEMKGEAAVFSDEFVFRDSNGGKRQNIFIVEGDTVISNLDSLYSVSVVKIDSLMESLDSTVQIPSGFSKRIKNKAGSLKRTARQVVTEIVSWDANTIDTAQLKTVLNDELKNRDIPIEFQFGIFSDSILYAHSEAADSAKLAGSEYKVELYPNAIFDRNLNLSVLFPGREGFIYRSLNWLLVASLIFSLFILTTFALSIFYILRQKKISEMKSDFINNMTHEFKTPIATISVATDSITNEKVVRDPERIKYFAGMIKKENARMNLQVEDILTIARLDRKDFEFNWEAIDSHELIKDAVQGIILQVEKRGGKIETHLDAKNSIITTDRKHCTNLIYNLLDNAMKYSAEAPEIAVATKNKTNGVVISVQDSGIGMSKSVQSKIFEKFYRQSSGNVHNVKGFGLGLSYVKAVLEANRGNISVQSEPGKGSKFDVFLPFVRE